MKDSLPPATRLLAELRDFLKEIILFTCTEKSLMKEHKKKAVIRKLAIAGSLAALIVLLLSHCSKTTDNQPETLSGCIGLIHSHTAFIATLEGQVEVSTSELPPDAKVNDTVVFKARKEGGRWVWVEFLELRPFHLPDWTINTGSSKPYRPNYLLRSTNPQDSTKL